MRSLAGGGDVEDAGPEALHVVSDFIEADVVFAIPREVIPTLAASGLDSMSEAKLLDAGLFALDPRRDDVVARIVAPGGESEELRELEFEVLPLDFE